MRPELQAHLDELTERYRAQRERLVGLQRQAAELGATVTTEDELITVTVGPQGRLTGLKFDPRVYRKYSSAELAATVLATVNQASEQVQGQFRELFPGSGSSFDFASVLPEDPSDLEAMKQRHGLLGE